MINSPTNRYFIFLLCLSFASGLQASEALTVPQSANLSLNEQLEMRTYRDEVFRQVKEGEHFDIQMQEHLSAFDSMSDHMQGHYENWKSVFAKAPWLGGQFGSAKGNYEERVRLTYRKECLLENRLEERDDEKNADIAHLRATMQIAADPLDRGVSRMYLGHLLRKLSNEDIYLLRLIPSEEEIVCNDAKRRSLRILPERLLKAYFLDSEINTDHYHYVANVSHRDESGEAFYVARIPKNGVQKLLLHQVNFGTGMEKLEERGLLGAAHFQMRLDFDEQVLLREQLIAKGARHIRGVQLKSLVHSVEANGKAPFQYNLFLGMTGILSEEAFGKFMNTFRLKTLDTVVYDSVMGRKGADRVRYPTLQYPIALSQDAGENKRLKNQVLANLIEQGDGFAEHTSYNTIERSCSVWGYENIDRDNVMGHKHFGSLKEYLPHRLSEALEERGLLPQLPSSTQVGRFVEQSSGLIGGEFFNLHHEVCAFPKIAERFDGINCDAAFGSN